MNISTNNNFTFKSFNQPVKPFSIKTKNDEIKFKEIDYTQPQSDEFLDNISEFFLDNFATQTANPEWQGVRKNTIGFNQNVYDVVKEEIFFKPLQKVLNDPDTTLMVGYNKNNKLVAGIQTQNLNLRPDIEDDKTLYVDSLAVDKQYRGNHIGQTLLNNVIESTENKYSDVFLVGYNESVPFYKKQNFTEVSDPKVTENLSDCVSEYPDYMTFLEKPIDKTQSRWTERVSKKIDLYT